LLIEAQVTYAPRAVMMYNPSSQTCSSASRFAAWQIQNPKVRFMLIRKLRDVSRAMFIGSILLALPFGAFAQEQKQAADPHQTEAQTGAPAKKSKGGADSCDGGLDIVPRKASTFARKRRPSKSEAKPEAKPESKSQ
jgi:hypothetical protein